MNVNCRKTILLVEDEALIAMAETMELEQRGYEVINAYSAEMAMDIFSMIDNIDLVLMDIDLGGRCDGTEVAREMLNRKESPIVFLSSHTEPCVVTRTEEITSYGYVVKNSGITVLDASIKMAFRLFYEKQRVREQQQELAVTNEELEAAIEELEATNEGLFAANMQLEESTSKVLEHEKALRINGEKLEEAQRIARLGHWHLDLVSDTLEWSDEIFRIFGLEPQEFGATYEAFLERVHPDDRVLVHNAYTQSLHTGEPYEIIHRLLLKSGEQKFVQERCVTEFDTQGNPLRSIGTVQDITDQKTAEDMRAARLRLVEYSVDHGVTELLRKFLDEAEALTGSEIGFYHFVEDDQETISLQTWSTNTLSKMCTAKGAGSHYPVTEAGVWVDCVRERRPVVHNEYENLPHRKGLPEGHARVVRELVVPVLRGNKIVAILGVGNKKTGYVDGDVRTVSELADMAWETIVRRRAEEELKESEERYRALFETMTFGIICHEADGTISAVNPAAERILGLSCDQMQGKAFPDIPWKAVDEGGSEFSGETYPSMVALRTGREVRNIVMGVCNSHNDCFCWVTVNAFPQYRTGEIRPFQVYMTLDEAVVHTPERQN